MPDVDHRVAHPDGGQHRQDHALARDDADDGQWQPPQRDSYAEQGGESTAIGEQRHGERADHRTGPDGRREHPNAGVPDAEDVDRDNHHEHAEASSGGHLGQRQPHEQEDARMTSQHAEPLDRLAEQVACPATAGAEGAASYDSPVRRSPAASVSTAAAPSTVAGSATTSSVAARAGPISVLRESTRPRTTLALVSSNGVRQSDGSRAE